MKEKLKLISILLVSTSLLLTKSWLVLGGVSVAVLSLVIKSGLGKKLLEWLKPLAVVVGLIIIIQIWSGAGFLAGGFFGLRLLILVTLVFWLVNTSSLADLAKALNWLPFGLDQVLLISLVLLPKTMSLTRQIINAQLARGLSFKTVKGWGNYPAIMVPLLNKMLKHSEFMALAMQARGFEEE